MNNKNITISSLQKLPFIFNAGLLKGCNKFADCTRESKNNYKTAVWWWFHCKKRGEIKSLKAFEIT